MAKIRMTIPEVPMFFITLNDHIIYFPNWDCSDVKRREALLIMQQLV